MKPLIGCLLWLCSLTLNALYAAESQIITTVAPQSTADASYRYYFDLLEKVLKASTHQFGPYELRSVEIAMSQARAIEEIAAGNLIQVYWTGTNIEREQKLIAVTIPLTKALLGYRVPVIRKADLAIWQDIDSLEKLQKMSACQVSDWPDSDILQASQIAVERVSVFKRIYSMLAGERCDFSPRGIQEVFSEISIAQQEHPDLIAFTDLIIYYPFPLYFFVAPTHPEIAQRLKYGLEKLIDSGEFDQFVTTHPVTAPIFPLSKWKNSRIIKLPNPLLPKTANPSNKRYWITPDMLTK